jgi:hypothetical protein
MVRTIVGSQLIDFTCYLEVSVGYTIGITPRTLTQAGPIGNIVSRVCIAERNILYLSVAVRHSDTDYAGTECRNFGPSTGLIFHAPYGDLSAW